MSESLLPYGLQHARLPWPSDKVCSNSCPLSRWCHPTILSSVLPLSCPQSFPASGSFPVSQLFTLDEEPKYWCFSFSISPSSEYSGLISFRIDWFNLLAVQGTFRILKESNLRCSAFFMVQLSHPHKTIGKNIALTLWIFVSKVVSLFIKMLSRFVIAFIPRSKCLLISWLQSPSTESLEPKKIKPVTISTFPLLFAIK